jgi:hypothetical protein
VVTTLLYHCRETSGSVDAHSQPESTLQHITANHRNSSSHRNMCAHVMRLRQREQLAHDVWSFRHIGKPARGDMDVA